jgi:glucosamine--fructose-6-phosphate aminotransferase (isomerizing)
LAEGMLEDILEQPDVILRIAKGDTGRLKEASRLLNGRTQIFIAARGSSMNAGLYARYIFETRSHISTSPVILSTITLYGSIPLLDPKKSALLAISQSGAGEDIVACVKAFRDSGIPTIAVTNTPSSPLGDCCDVVLDCMAGPERAIPATKSYTGELAMIYALAEASMGNEDLGEILSDLAERMRYIISISDPVLEMAVRRKWMERLWVISRGYNLPTALEVSLKVMETCYVHSIGISAADFLHGPIAAFGDGDVAMLFSAGKGSSSSLEVGKALLGEGADLIAFGDVGELMARGAEGISLELPIPEELTPILLVLFGQFFALGLARAKGLDPDRPRRLRKVTSTR